MATAAAVLGGLILLAAAIKSLPTIWSAIKLAARAPFVIDAVAKEFAPNGGNSLRDRIDHLGDRLDAHVAESDRKHDEAINLVREMADLSTLIRQVGPGSRQDER